SHASNGCSSCSRSLVGDTSTTTSEPSSGGGVKVFWPGSYPLSGSTSPTGGSSLTCVPSGAVMVSLVGSKSSCPDSAKAMTVSGDVTKLKVLAEPSLRFGKLRLNELTIVLGTPLAEAGRSHWPM